MRKFILIILICSLSACAFKDPLPAEQDILASREALQKNAASRTMVVKDEPYLGAKRMAVSKADLNLSRQISLSLNGTLQDVASQAAPLTDLGWTVADLSSNQRVRFSGSIQSFCDYLADLYGVGWEFNELTQTLTFSKVIRKTFTLIAAPGKVAYKNQITNQSKENSTNAGGGTFGQTVNASDISSQTAQSNQSDLTLDVWAEALAAIKGMLSKTGTVSANLAGGTVTVVDNAPQVRMIGKFIHEFNTKLSRQVALDVKVWQLEINNATDIGLNIQALFEDSKLLLSTGMSLNWPSSGGELSATITDGKLKNSNATLKALSTYGRTTLLTSGSGITMNNQPLPVQNTTKDTYLAGMSLNTNDYGQTSQITPGEITTGFAMTVIPHILDRRQLILQYNTSLTSLDAIREYTNENVKVEMPKVSTRAFSQRVTMQMGQTLVLAGFEQENKNQDSELGILAIGRQKNNSRSVIIITISVESMPGYELGGNNG